MAIGWVILILYCAAGLSWFIACMLLRGGDQKSPPIHGGQGDRRERALVRANWTAGIKPWGSQKHTGVYLGFCLKGIRVGILVFVLYKSCYFVMTNPWYPPSILGLCPSQKADGHFILTVMENGRFWARHEKKMCPGGATCLPHLGKVRAQKWDKTRLKTTVSGEERQMPKATPIATRNDYIRGDIVSICLWRWTRDWYGSGQQLDLEVTKLLHFTTCTIKGQS